jgi:hypothetical protein
MNIEGRGRRKTHRKDGNRLGITFTNYGRLNLSQGPEDLKAVNHSLLKKRGEKQPHTSLLVISKPNYLVIRIAKPLLIGQLPF